jgi:hypothetical protein
MRTMNKVIKQVGISFVAIFFAAAVSAIAVNLSGATNADDIFVIGDGVFFSVLAFAIIWALRKKFTYQYLMGLTSSIEQNSNQSIQFKRNRRFEIAAIIFFALSATVPFLFVSVPEIEGQWSTIFSTLVHLKAIAVGHYPFWFDGLGLGVPAPFGVHLIFHPVSWFFLLFNYNTALFAVYCVQSTISGLCLWGLLIKLGVHDQRIRLTAVASWLLSPAVMQYIYIEYAPSILVASSSIPIIIFTYVSFVEAKINIAKLQWAALLGLTTGLVYLSGHLGHLYTVTIIIALTAALTARRIITLFPFILICSIIFFAIFSDKLFMIIGEYSLFPPDIPRIQNAAELGYQTIWSAFFRPFFRPSFSIAAQYISNLEFLALTEYFIDNFSSRNSKSRYIYFGSIFTIISILSIFVPYKKTYWEKRIIILFLTSLLFFLAPTSTLGSNASSNWFFRDSVALFGIILASLTLSRISLNQKHGRLVRQCSLLQVIFVVLSACGLIIYSANLSIGLTPNIRNATIIPQKISTYLKKTTERHSGRLLYSPSVSRAIRSNRLVAAGLWVNTLPLQGVQTLNGPTKGISTATLTPPNSLMYGGISAKQFWNTVRADPSALNTFGVSVVLAFADEKLPISLREIVRIPTPTGKDFVILVNDTAWPLAVDINPDYIGQSDIWRVECAQKIFLCVDHAKLQANRFTTHTIKSSQSYGMITSKLADNTAEGRTLLFSQMYRPGWAAEADGVPVKIVPFAGRALISVAVPANTHSVQLMYEPPLRRITFWLMLLGIILGFSVVLICLYKRRKFLPPKHH